MSKVDVSKIQFHYVDVQFNFSKRNCLKAYLLEKLNDNGKEVEAINYIFCDDDYLLSINRSYLSHSTLTDIITFELSSPGQPLLADIFISINRVKENRKIFKTSFKKELHRVIFHGALHLCGLKDKTDQQSIKMRAAENAYLADYFVSRGTKTD